MGGQRPQAPCPPAGRKSKAQTQGPGIAQYGRTL